MRYWLWAKKRQKHLFAAALSGVLYFLGFCGFGYWWFAWVCLVPILWVLHDPSLSLREVLGFSWLFGVITHLGGYTFVIHVLTTFAHFPWPLAWLGYFLLCVYQSGQLALWGVGSHVMSGRWGVPWFVVAPAWLVIVEWLYPLIFPSMLANSQFEQLLLIQSVDLWGPLGISALVAFGNMLAYRLIFWRLRPRQGGLAVAGWTLGALLTATLLYGYGSSVNIDDTIAHSDRGVRVGLVQTNMGIYEKIADPQEGLRRHREQSEELQRQGADVIVWPETAYHFPIVSTVTNVKGKVLGNIQTPLIFGGIRAQMKPAVKGKQEREIFNSVFATDAQGNIVGSYDKRVLLAFGEYIPFGDWFPSLYELLPYTSNFSRGTHNRALSLAGIRYGLLICYEDIIPSFVRRVMEDSPDILINVTNDSWFGDSQEPKIHLAMATFRAVETRRYLVRATNTGISAVIDPVGRILQPTPTFQRANVLQTVHALDDITFYVWLGDWVAWLSCAALIWFLREHWLRWGRTMVRRVKRSRSKQFPSG